MGDSKPACSSKQTLYAFEDAHLLQAKVGAEDETCLLSDITQTHLYLCTHSRVITKTSDRFDAQLAWRHAHAIKEVLKTEQIVHTLEVKVMGALFRKDI